MLHLGEDAPRLRHHKVGIAHEVYIPERRNEVGIQKTGIHHGNRHSLSAESPLVQLHSAHHLQLRLRHSVGGVYRGVALLYLGVVFGARRIRHDGIRRHPHHPDIADEGQLGEAPGGFAVLGAHHNGVAPAAATHHLHPRQLLHLVHILLRHGHIERVHADSLSAASLQCLCREEREWIAHHVQRWQLVGERESVHIMLAAGIWYLRRTVGACLCRKHSREQEPHEGHYHG